MIGRHIRTGPAVGSSVPPVRRDWSEDRLPAWTFPTDSWKAGKVVVVAHDGRVVLHRQCGDMGVVHQVAAACGGDQQIAHPSAMVNVGLIGDDSAEIKPGFDIVESVV